MAYGDNDSGDCDARVQEERKKKKVTKNIIGKKVIKNNFLLF